MADINYDMLCSEIRQIIQDETTYARNKELIDNETNPYVPNLIEIYEDRILPIQKQTFDEFLKDLLQSKFETTLLSEDLKELRNNTVRNSNKTKKRWFSTVEEDIENEFATTRLTIQELSLIYKTTDKSQMKIIQYEKIKTEWLTPKNSLLSEYRYFGDKKPKQQVSAYTNDLTLKIIEIALTIFNGSIRGYTVEQVIDLVDHPIFSPNRFKISFDEGMDESNSPMVFNDYEVDGNYILRYIIKEKDKVDIKSLYVLDRKDWQIINLIFSRVIPDKFIKDRSVVVDIGEIVFNIHGNNAGSAYKDIEKRIEGIPLYHISGLIKEGENIKDTIFSINFFDNAIITTDPDTKKRYAKIVFGEVLYDRFVRGITVGVTGRQMKYLEDNTAKMLFYALQKERLTMSVNKNHNLTTVLNYTTFFRHKIRLRGQKSTNMKTIRTSLKHYKDKQILIKDFSVEKDNFIVEFYPLTESEKNEFGLKLDQYNSLEFKEAD